MLKKIISAVLILSAVCQFSTFYVTAEEAYDDADIKLIEGLGLIEFDEDNLVTPDNLVTREHFADIINNILNYNQAEIESKWEFFGSDNENSIQDVSDNDENLGFFYDVDSTREYYNPINNVAASGLMIGANGYFKPDEVISVREALAVFIRLLGYDKMAEMNGGWFNGYVNVASNLGIKYQSLDKEATYADISYLLAQVIETPLMLVEITHSNANYMPDEEKTILSELLNVKKIKGILTQNDITSLTGKSTLSETEIEIDGIVLNTTENTRYINQFIGREVVCYYFNEESENEYDVIYAYKSKRNDEISFKLDDFIEYENSTFTFEANDKIISKNIVEVPYVIYNGLAVTGLKDEYFDFQNGTITLLSTGSNGYNLVIIDAYKPVLVKSIYRDAGKITIINEIAAYNEQAAITFDEDELGKNVRIYNQNGEEADWSVISVDTVFDISQNGNVFSIILSDSKVVENFSIKKIIHEDAVSDGEKEYKISDAYTHSKIFTLYRVGDVCSVYLNSFGYVVCMKRNRDSNSWELGYVYRFSYDDAEEKITARILTGTGKVEPFVLDEKIRFNNANGIDNIKRESNHVLCQELKNSEGVVIRYKINEEDLITALELPLNENAQSKSDDRLFVMKDCSNTLDNNYYYTQGFKNFGSKLFLDNSVQILSIPEQRDEIDKYRFVNTSEMENGTKKFTAYGLDKESVKVCYTLLYESVSLNFDDKEYPYIITNIYKGLNSDDEPVKVIEAYQQGKSYTFYDSIDNGHSDKAVPFSRWEDTDGMKENEYYSIEEGDIVMIKADSFGRVAGLKIIFDSDGVYDNSKYAQDFSSCEEFDEDFTWKEKGTLAGSIGYFSSKITNTNPVTQKKTQLSTNAANYFDVGSPRFIYGYVYDIEDGIITYTTANLHEMNGLPDASDKRFVTESRRMQTISDLLNLNGNKVSASAATTDKIKTYKDYGKNCSRILFQSWLYDDRYGIIINGSK